MDRAESGDELKAMMRRFSRILEVGELEGVAWKRQQRAELVLKQITDHFSPDLALSHSSHAAHLGAQPVVVPASLSTN